MSTQKIAGLRFSPDAEPEILGNSKLAVLIEKPQFTVPTHFLKADGSNLKNDNTSLNDAISVPSEYDSDIDDLDTDRD